MLGSAAIRTGVTAGGSLAPGWSEDRIAQLAGSTPNLDLRFAETKSLVDSRSAKSLVAFSRASAGTYFDSEGVLRTATTNLLIRSEELQTGWVATRLSVLADADVAPDGSLTADKLVEDTSVANTRYTQQLRAFTAGLTYTYSVYAKAVERTHLFLVVGNVNTLPISIRFNVSNGTVTSNTLGIPAIQPVGNGWYRCSVTATALATASTNVVLHMLDNTNSSTYTGDGTSGLLLWGAQLEQSSVAGEYIRTTSVINSAPRFNHDPRSGESLGLLIESQVTNIVLHNRTLTEAVWVATNITAAKNQTGIDRVTNSASSITATAANGTILQTITSTSVSRITSAYVKRLTGTGQIQFTQDGGTTWTNVSVSNDWDRVNVPAATVANPVVGFRITSNGDSIAVDYVQCEINNQITSPIETAAATVTRSADVCSISGSNLSSFYVQDNGSWFCEANSFRLTSALSLAGFIGLDVDVFARGYAIGATSLRIRGVRRDAATQNNIDYGTGVTLPAKVSMLATASESRISSNNRTIVFNNTALTLDPISHLRIGWQNVIGSDNERYLNGCVARLCYWPVRLNDASLLRITR